MKAKKESIIFGGSGFVGNALIDEILKQGWQVKNFDLIEPLSLSQQTYTQGDVRDSFQVEKAAEGIDTVFICTSLLPLSKNKNQLHEVNVKGLENILHACSKHRVRKIIYISSSAVYGRAKQTPINEDSPKVPFEEYGKSKLAGESLCYQKMQEGLDITIVRPRTVLGPGRLGIFQILFEWIFQGYTVPLFGKRTSRYQFVHVEDLARCSVAASLKSGSNDFNCGAAEFSFLYDELQALCDYAKSGAKVKLLPRQPFAMLTHLAGQFGFIPLAAYHAFMYGETFYFSTTKVEHNLNFKPQYSNMQMLLDSYDFYRLNREKILTQNGRSPHQSLVSQRLLTMVKHFL